MERRLIILGELDNLNDLLNATNHNKFVGASMKKRNTKKVAMQLENEEPLPINGHYTFHWHKSSKRADPDNIASAVKFIFDGLQEAGVIPNDNWAYIKTIDHRFHADVDKDAEFVEVVVMFNE